MVKRNPTFGKVAPGYLFPEINKRKQTFLKNNPDAKLISLGIGNTTQPLSIIITDAMAKAAQNMSTREGYTGYGPEQGEKRLRELISEKIYHGKVTADEIFISDGAKCDIGRLQHLFGPDTRIAIQDPAYPVYVDTTVITDKRPAIIYLPCTPENEFFPDINKLPNADVFFICSPNNPTGTVLSQEQLTSLVNHAKKEKSVIIFDSAYACFIQDDLFAETKSNPHLKSIYEIPGAKEVAIEVNSFSKMAGFTGLRLGWSVVPNELQYDDGSSIQKDWSRIITTFYNGASYIVQQGGIAALSDAGLKELDKTIQYYLTNARLLREFFTDKGFKTYGGEYAPYIWVDFRPLSSWEVFDQLLNEFHIISTPGSGFGQAGEGFVRLSAFSDRKDVEEALLRMNSKKDFGTESGCFRCENLQVTDF